MLLSTHALVGAYLTQKIASPAISLPLSFVSHWLLDAIPHWDFDSKKHPKSKKKLLVLSSFNFFLATLLCYLLFQKHQSFNPTLWLGAFLAISPDLLDASYFIYKIKLFPPLTYLHCQVFHTKKQTPPLGLLTEVAITLLIIFLS